MNSYPEGTGDTTQDIYELDNPQAYKYVRYIRTKYKSGSDYGVWLWSPSKGGDGGNRLNVQDISFYSKTTPLPVTVHMMQIQLHIHGHLLMSLKALTLHSQETMRLRIRLQIFVLYSEAATM